MKKDKIFFSALLVLLLVLFTFVSCDKKSEVQESTTQKTGQQSVSTESITDSANTEINSVESKETTGDNTQTLDVKSENTIIQNDVTFKENTEAPTTAKTSVTTAKPLETTTESTTAVTLESTKRFGVPADTEEGFGKVITFN